MVSLVGIPWYIYPIFINSHICFISSRAAIIALEVENPEAKNQRPQWRHHDSFQSSNYNYIDRFTQTRTHCSRESPLETFKIIVRTKRVLFTAFHVNLGLITPWAPVLFKLGALGRAILPDYHRSLFELGGHPQNSYPGYIKYILI